MRGGGAHRSVWLCWETGVLDILLPELSAYLSDVEQNDGRVWRILSQIDRLTQERGAPLDDVVLWAGLLLDPISEACAGARDRMTAATDFLEPVIDRLNVPRRIADAVRRIAAIMPRLESGRPGRFGGTGLFRHARDVLALVSAETEHGEAPESPADAEAPATDQGAPRRRRRRRPRRKGTDA
jgi:poly(A) polymerase